jgi:L-gulono-1,4-lactone dehydrogenase
MRVLLRAKWQNHTRNQGVDPLARVSPTSLEELVAAVQQAESEGCTIRAVGSGHSWSDVALAPGFLVEPEGLAEPLELDFLRGDVDASGLVRVESGMRVRELNAHLDASGRALKIMGGYDGQTVAGVVSTATHGSGINFGPIADAVQSMDLVASGGTVWRIERAGGPTDPQAFATARPDHELRQDDDLFNAAVVSMGCMGILYSVTLAVDPLYYLTEVRTKSTWAEVSEQLRAREVPHSKRHYEVYLNPYGERLCMICTRDYAPEAHKGRGSRGRRNLLTEWLAAVPGFPLLLNLIADLRPQWTPWMLDMALKGLADREYTDKSYRVFNIGRANDLPAYSAEIGVPVDDAGTHVEAVERICEIADQHRSVGEIYHTSPIALRFVAASPAWMAMMEGRPTMMIELIQMTRTEGGLELLAAYEDALYELGGRPHWGQINTLAAGRLESLYPRFHDWLEKQQELNESGVFDSPFAKRVGISPVAGGEVSLEGSVAA